MSTPLVVLETQRATNRALTGPLALDVARQLELAGQFADAARRTGDQPFAQALAAPPLELARQRASMFKGDDVVLFGIGGSALGPTVIHEALRPASPWRGRKLHVLDHLDPLRCVATIEEGWQRGAHFCVISKSGDTTETMALAAMLDAVARPSGASYGKDRVTIVTNEEPAGSAGNTAIRCWARAIGAPAIDMPVPLGGRYSVMSAVGFVPAALLGYDIDALFDGATWMLNEVLEVDEGEGVGHPALELAATLYALDRDKGCGTQVVMPYLHCLERFGAWFVQLWAESLGKKGASGEPAGPSGPVGGVGPTDQHSFAQLLLEGRRDKVVVFVDAQGDGEAGPRIVPNEAFDRKIDVLRNRTLGQILATECFATELALWEQGRPSVALRTATFDAKVLGALFVLFEATTYLAGAMYGVNPYDQPGVQLIKRYIKDGLATGAGDGRADSDTLGRELLRNGGYPRQVPRQ